MLREGFTNSRGVLLNPRDIPGVLLGSLSPFSPIQVSKAAAELLSYCEAHACEDPLLTPVPTSENPFREKKFFCALL